MPLPVRTDHRTDAQLREAFHVFVSEVFGGEIGFRSWEAAGFWTDRYRPYSIVDGDRMIANASVCDMQLLINDSTDPVPGLQFATVGVVPDRRGEGHAARLMRHILTEHGPGADRSQSKSPFAFLYGNEDVLDFYPKFGFRPFREQLFRTRLRLDPTHAAAPERTPLARLDLNTPDGMREFRARIARRAPHTLRFGAANYDHILAFHAMHFFPDDLLLLPRMPDAHAAAHSNDVLLIASREGDALQIYDVVFDHAPDPAEFQQILARAAAHYFRDEPERTACPVVYHFTPELLDPEAEAFETEFESPLFIHSQAPEDFPMRGPLKFPALAQT